MRKEKYKFGEEVKIGKSIYLYCGNAGRNLIGNLLITFRSKSTGKLINFPVDNKIIKIG